MGGWGTKIFQVSAVGHGRRVLGRLGLRGPDESDLPVKHMATKRLGAARSVLVRALLGFTGRTAGGRVVAP